MKILIAEDDPTIAGLLEGILGVGGYRDITLVPNGVAALLKLQSNSYDAVLTDLMMPEMDGLQLTREIRRLYRPGPVILVVTALDEARDELLEAGADEYIVKPFTAKAVVAQLGASLERAHQPMPTRAAPNVSATPAPRAGRGPRSPFVAVCIASSTGGPVALKRVIPSLSPSLRAVYFVVQHGPAWMLEALVGQLSRESKVKVVIAKDGARCRPGTVYVAPGDQHLTVDAGAVIRLNRDDAVNHVRPSADPLFDSVAAVFGDQSIAVVLTGLGRDACAGACSVESAGGAVLIQDPTECVAPSMPDSVVKMGVTHTRRKLGELATEIEAAVAARIG